MPTSPTPSILDEVRQRKALSVTDLADLAEVGVGSPAPLSQAALNREPDAFDPTLELDSGIRELIVENIENVPPSERDRYLTLMEQVAKSRSDKARKDAVRVYYDLFCFNDPKDCFRFEELTREEGFIAVQSQHAYQSGDRMLYWVAVHVRPALYAKLRAPFLSRSQRREIEREASGVSADGEDVIEAQAADAGALMAKGLQHAVAVPRWARRLQQHVRRRAKWWTGVVTGTLTAATAIWYSLPPEVQSAVLSFLEGR